MKYSKERTVHLKIYTGLLLLFLLSFFCLGDLSLASPNHPYVEIIYTADIRGTIYPCA